MRVLTWNLWWKFGPWELRQVAIMETLREQNADIIFLQEIHTGDNQPARLAEQLGFHYVTTHSPWDMGNAILSRWPIVHHEQICLPDAQGQPAHRRALWAIVQTPWGKWPVVCTHLDHRFDESHVRLLQVDALADLVADVRGDPAVDLPVIVGGDFNAVPDSAEIRRLTGRSAVKIRNLVFADMWEQQGQGVGHTWSSHNPYLADANWPNRRIDYLFVTWPRLKPAGHPRRVWLAGVDAVNNVQPSDHFAVVADVDVPRSPSE